MRMRYRHVTYRYTDGSQKQLERYYRQLLHDALRQSQQPLLYQSTTWRPPTDIFESEERVTVKIELAGMNEEDIEVTLYEDALIISGERQNDQQAHENLCYYEAQVRYGPFRVEVFLPSPVARDAVTARYENGFLWVDLPLLLTRETKPEQIRIQSRETKA
jgi:HSP20 family protein